LRERSTSYAVIQRSYKSKIAAKGRKETNMARTLITVATAILISAAPAFAADDAQTPPSGGADTSTGAKEQSSAPPGSDAAEDMTSGSTAGESSDTSSGAKEQSSAPPGSDAADKSKSNPDTGSSN
jgi:hypothetical protein